MDDSQNQPPDEAPMSGAVEIRKGVIQASIVSEMRRSYLDYAMSVIVQRALPDVRDGLKPVHRRILYAMHKLGLSSNAKYRKSATVVGEVLGKYHPHGDSPVYEALARMAQSFTLRYPLINGQGNFGSIDGDPPAAMRYTEAKLEKIADEVLGEIEKDTVEFVDNYDGSQQEPVYLPSRLPNLLLMGAEGIAVGMATKIPPHNLTEIANAVCETIDKAMITVPADKQVKERTIETARIESAYVSYDVSVDDLTKHVKGPDFPTYGVIYGARDIKEMYETGRGKIIVRGVIEEHEGERGRDTLIITELPYQTNKANLVEKIAMLHHEKKLAGISDLRDESAKGKVRIVIELKKDATPKQVINNLFKYTELQTSFPANIVALVDGTPQTLGLKPILEHYIRHRIDVIIRRSEHELKAAKHRAHILEGYLIALDNIDEVVKIIRASKTEAEAKEKLMSRFGLSLIQSQAILEMQLRRLVGLERDKIENELAELRKLISYLESILKDVTKVLEVIRAEVVELVEKYGDKRRTKVVAAKPGEITDEQLIENKETIIVMSQEGYIKQIPQDSFRVQGRGGKGVIGMETKETDNIAYIKSAMAHDWILFFSNMGRVFQTRVWDVPAGTRTSKGKAVQNVIALRPDEKVTSILTYDKEVQKSATTFVVMSTKAGTVKKTSFDQFANIRANGIIAINLDAGDELLWVNLTAGQDNVILTTHEGKTIIFKEDEIRPTGRSSRGVRGIAIDKKDYVVASDTFGNEEFKKDLFVIGERGIGKKSQLALFKDQHRGGKGVKVASVDDKMGRIAFVRIVDEDVTDVIITSHSGQVVKIPLKEIPSRSRSAKGVILMRFSSKDDVVGSAALV